jgi:hypothetical protein
MRNSGWRAMSPGLYADVGWQARRARSDAPYRRLVFTFLAAKRHKEAQKSEEKGFF